MVSHLVHVVNSLACRPPRQTCRLCSLACRAPPSSADLATFHPNATAGWSFGEPALHALRAVLPSAPAERRAARRGGSRRRARHSARATGQVSVGPSRCSISSSIATPFSATTDRCLCLCACPCPATALPAAAPPPLAPAPLSSKHGTKERETEWKRTGAWRRGRQSSRSTLTQEPWQGGLRPHHYCLPILKREEVCALLLVSGTTGPA